MRVAFAYESLLKLPEDNDVREPGGAITIALCGSYEHEGPCPLAPHHTAAERVDGGVRTRTLFAVEPERRGEVESLIEGALAKWQASGGPSAIRPEEVEHAQRLIDS